METWNREANAWRLPRGSPMCTQPLTAGHSCPEASRWREEAQNPQRQRTAAALFHSSAVAFSFFSSSSPPLPTTPLQKSVIPFPLPHASAQDPPTPAPKALTPESPAALPLAPRAPKKERYDKVGRLNRSKAGHTSCCPDLI